MANFEWQCEPEQGRGRIPLIAPQDGKAPPRDGMPASAILMAARHELIFPAKETAMAAPQLSVLSSKAWDLAHRLAGGSRSSPDGHPPDRGRRQVQRSRSGAGRPQSRRAASRGRAYPSMCRDEGLEHGDQVLWKHGLPSVGKGRRGYCGCRRAQWRRAALGVVLRRRRETAFDCGERIGLAAGRCGA